MQRAAVALGAGTVENPLAILLDRIQFGVRVRKTRAGTDRVAQRLDSQRRK
jgi:hypothetical protein